MKTKKQTEKQELKYAPGDKVVYHCAGTDRSGTIMYVDDTDKVAPYRISNHRQTRFTKKKRKLSQRLLRNTKLSRARSTWRNSTTWSTWLLQTEKDASDDGRIYAGNRE
jgi:hypothetical protein